MLSVHSSFPSPYVVWKDIATEFRDHILGVWFFKEDNQDIKLF